MKYQQGLQEGQSGHKIRSILEILSTLPSSFRTKSRLPRMCPCYCAEDWPVLSAEGLFECSGDAALCGCVGNVWMLPVEVQQVRYICLKLNRSLGHHCIASCPGGTYIKWFLRNFFCNIHGLGPCTIPCRDAIRAISQVP